MEFDLINTNEQFHSQLPDSLLIQGMDSQFHAGKVIKGNLYTATSMVLIEQPVHICIDFQITRFRMAECGDGEDDVI